MYQSELNIVKTSNKHKLEIRLPYEKPAVKYLENPSPHMQLRKCKGQELCALLCIKETLFRVLKRSG